MNNEKSGGSVIGAIFLLILILALAEGLNNSDQGKQLTSTNYPQETWQRYSSSINQDVSNQLTNTQNLVVALSQDIDNLQVQNVDLKSALITIETQLNDAKVRFEEENRRQQRDQWITTIVGIIAGILGGAILPDKFRINLFKNNLIEKKSSKRKESQSFTALSQNLINRIKENRFGQALLIIELILALLLITLLIYIYT